MKNKCLLGSVNYAFMVSNLLPRGSHVWNNLLKTREFPYKNIMWQARNGSSKRFWKDLWSSPIPLEFHPICSAIEIELTIRFESYV